MAEQIKHPERHPSYQKHRGQFWTQIILPVIATALVMITAAVLIGMAAFGTDGDPQRWAAVSTIWLVIPLMFFGLLFLATLIALIYLLARALKIIPPFTSNAQITLYRVSGKTKNFSDGAAKPVFFVEGILASIKAIFGRY